MKEVALITLHGMGKVKHRYYEDLEKALQKSLADDWSKVSFQNVQYAPIFQEPEDKLWNKMIRESSNDLDFRKLRQFFLFGFADAASLEASGHKYPEKYKAVQETIQKALKKAYVDLDEDNSKPVIIIAQSLGVQVISNYLWDAEHNKFIFKDSDANDDLTNFLKLKSLKNLISTGSNLPLFVAGVENRKCFSKPNPDFNWDNYYDSDDVLGWPLKQLGESYEFINDHVVNVGGIVTAWNPASHGEYWSDKDVINPLSKIIKSHLS